MNGSLFDPPIHLLCSCRAITKIESAKDGFDFLLTCPNQEGPIFESALAVCFAALANPSLSADARRGLATFARIHGFLADSGRRRTTERDLRFR